MCLCNCQVSELSQCLREAISWLESQHWCWASVVQGTEWLCDWFYDWWFAHSISQSNSNVEIVWVMSFGIRVFWELFTAYFELRLTLRCCKCWFLPAWHSKCGICYGNMALCVSVTRWYYIKMAKPILKLFDNLVALSFQFLPTPAPIPNSKGNPSAGTLNTRGWE